MSKINVLSQSTANQIAAGEVAERPTLIIKELIENSMDAGATSVRIFLKNSGFEQIRIIDDGEGIAKDEILTAFLRHATSKLTSIEDLTTLFTMGFRGEALASIAAVSKISITTKPINQDTGYRGTIEGGAFRGIETAPCNNGTEIIVDDLFYNTPARKKFLATPTRELRDVSDMIGKMIISNPSIRFDFRNNNKKIFQSSGNGSMSDAIMCVYGRELTKKLVPLDDDIFHGYISHPGYTKPSRSYYHFYINNRYIQNDSLNRSLETAYHTLLPERRFPVAFININLDPKCYDINVHPNKLDIKFNNECNIEGQLILSVENALLGTERAYSQGDAVINKVASPPKELEIESEIEEKSSEPKSNHKVKPDRFEELKENMNPAFSPFSLNALDELMELDADEREAEAVKRAEKAINPKENFKNTEETSSLESILESSLFKERESLDLKTNFNEFTKQKLDLESGFYSSLMILGQLAATFIVAAKEDALYLIDQHAAHERLLFNKIKEAVSNEDTARQPLLIPLEFVTNYKQYSWVLEHIVLLRNLGFILEEFGDNSFIVREVPFWAQDINVVSFLEELTDGLLKESEKLTAESLTESKIMMRACKSAIKANRYLDKSDIHYLFSELDLAKDAFTCPHGRPITIKYSVDEIRRKFLRS